MCVCVCVCVCVFRISVLKIAIERWFWKVNMVFESLVELLAWLHSCLCFSLLEKLFLKASSTPPRHLLDTWLSVELPSFFLLQSWHLLDTWWVDRESSYPLDSFSTPGGLIEPHLLCLMFCTSTLPRHLYLSTAKSSTLGSTPWSTPSFVEIYWGSIYYPYVIQPSFLSIPLSSLLPKHLLSL